MDVLKKNLIVAIISQYIHILNRLIVQLKKITSYSLSFLPPSHRESRITVPILQMRKLRLQEVK